MEELRPVNEHYSLLELDKAMHFFKDALTECYDEGLSAEAVVHALWYCLEANRVHGSNRISPEAYEVFFRELKVAVAKDIQERTS